MDFSHNQFAIGRAPVEEASVRRCFVLAANMSAEKANLRIGLLQSVRIEAQR